VNSGTLQYHLWGTWWHSWLRHCATSQKVMGSIPSVVTGIFHWHNLFGCTVAQGSIQPLTEMSSKNIPGGYRWPVPKADNLTTFMCWLAWNLGASTSCSPQSLYSDWFTLFLQYHLYFSRYLLLMFAPLYCYVQGKHAESILVWNKELLSTTLFILDCFLLVIFW